MILELLPQIRPFTAFSQIVTGILGLRYVKIPAT